MNKNRSKGRPTDLNKQQLQKTKLLDATQELLASKSYIEVTIREVAERAGLNSAMVRYYFNNKEGLFLALLEQMSKQHFNNMIHISEQKDPIKHFIQFMLKMLSNNNSFARLIHDEFAHSNSKLSDAFIEKFPKRMAKFLPQLIKQNTSITDDRKAKQAAFTLVSMIVMPFIGLSVRKKAWGISDDEISSNQWAEHIHSSFIFGFGKNADKNDN